MTWQQAVEAIGSFIDQCFERRAGTLVCEWCPAHDYCEATPEKSCCSDVLRDWAKEQVEGQ